jgi:preprotein translocase subunit SecA
MLADLGTILPVPDDINPDFVYGSDRLVVEDTVLSAAEDLYEQREQQYGGEIMRVIERAVMLQVIDRLWVQHLTRMSNLRQGIGLHAYGQRDPLVMYKKEGHEAFEGLLEQIRHDIGHTIYHVAPANPRQPGRVPAKLGETKHRMASVDTNKTTTVMSQVAGSHGTDLASSTGKKIGRNDPCWCGSGKKFKRCHGLAA